jgi:hypothetical protein
VSRRVYLLGVGLNLLALAFVVTDALLWEPGLTEASARRIRDRMTMKEVEAILGPCSVDPSEGRPSWRTVREWRGRHVRGYITFGPDERVMQEFAEGPVILRPYKGSTGPLARLRAWQGW